MPGPGRALRAVCGCAAALAVGAAILFAAHGPGRQAALLRLGLTALNSPAAARAIYRAGQAQPPTAADAAEPPQAPASAALAPQRPSPTPSGGAGRPAATPAPSATPGPSPTLGFSPLPSAPASPLATATPTPAIPADAGRITSLRYRGDSGSVKLAAGSIQNATEHTDRALAAVVADPAPAFTVQRDSDLPQVLILHTHATESYQNWEEPLYDPDYSARTRDRTQNVCAVGERMAQVLLAAGINTLHDTTLHDDPSYTEAYARSAATARAYLERYPSIKVILDVHRDAIESGGARLKPLAEVEGEATAQVMLIAGCDNGGTVPLPNWRKNLGFAAAWEQQMETLYPGLTRPVLCGYRFYNQDITTGSLLIEVGGHANTLQEALRGGELAANALAALLLGGAR